MSERQRLLLGVFPPIFAGIFIAALRAHCSRGDCDDLSTRWRWWAFGAVWAGTTVLSAFGIFTVNRIVYRPIESRRDELIYRQGAQRFGLAVGTVMAVLMARRSIDVNDLSWLTFSDFLVWLVIGALAFLPAGMWAGLLWGWAMARMILPPPGE